CSYDILYAFQKDLDELKTTSKIANDDFKALMKQHKLQRQNERNKLKNVFSQEEQQQLEAELIKQSLYDKHLLRTLTNDFLTKESELNEKIAVFTQKIDLLKDERKTKSNALQNWLFTNYTFLNSKKEEK